MTIRFCNTHKEMYDDEDPPFACPVCNASANASTKNKRYEWESRGRSRGNGEYTNLVGWIALLTIEVALGIFLARQVSLHFDRPHSTVETSDVLSFGMWVIIYLAAVWFTLRRILKWVRYEI